MQLRNVLRRTTEFGIGTIAIAIMLLAGCGGGGGTSSSAATCSATGNVSGADAVNCFFAEGATSWNADLISGMTNWAGTASAVAQASTDTFVAIGSNTYTYKVSFMDLATSSSVWSTYTFPNSSEYYLTAAGWQPYDFLAATITNNGNGTVASITSYGFQSNVSSMTRTDLTGQPVTCTNPPGSYVVGENIGSASSPVIVATASCPVAVTYPAGSASYTTTVNSTQNELYLLWNYPTPSTTLTDGTGVALSALPSIGTRFCINGMVFDPIAGAAAGADNYTEYYNYPFGTCSAADINNAINTGYSWPALIGLKNTGNAAVPTVFDIKVTYLTDTTESMYDFHLGKMMYVSYTPASTSTTTSSSINKTAASAQLQANGLPPLP